ncbi:MAG: ATP-binding protein [Candidatus Omnitrophica bacterium]|nr:ATP-binding protein [Candidatus Omnitrophota bacterium]
MNISKTIPSKTELINELLSSVLAKLSDIGLDPGAIFNIKLALYEAMVNAVKHGNKLNPDLKVKLEINIQNGNLIMQVSDEGTGFDYKNIPNPLTSKNLERLSGRGIFLIEKIMDKFEFMNEGRTIKMVKFLNKKKEEK